MKRSIYIGIIILEIIIVVPALLYLHFNYFTSEKVTLKELEVNFKNGDNSLFGILSLPNQKGTFPAIILLHGSDRSGAENYKEYADNLVKAGYAILRYDSPGFRKSTGNTFGETFDERVDEVLSAIEFLSSKSEINANFIGLWGISQGGWICQMAAAKSDKVAFIIPVSGPGVSVPEQELYRVEFQSKEAGFSNHEIRKAVLIRRLLIDIVLSNPKYKSLNVLEVEALGAGPWNDLISLAYSEQNLPEPKQLEILIHSLSSINKESWSEFIGTKQVLPLLQDLPPEAFKNVIKGMETNLLFNPAAYLNKINVPVLALFGEADTSIPVEKSIRIYKSNLKENLSLKSFPEASHSIMLGDSIHPDFFPSQINWLKTLKTKIK